jgi:S1-C subfamily serine protease
MKLIVRGRQVVALLLVVLAIVVGPETSEADEATSPEALRRLIDVLVGRRVGRLEDLPDAVGTRATTSLRELFRSTVRAVPIVLSQDGNGSGIVVEVNRAESSAWVITSGHVVDKPFQTNKGAPFVLLLFYDRELASEAFEHQRIARCIESDEKTAWCRTFQRSVRRGVIVGVDRGRDLALISVSDVPSDVAPVATVNLGAVEAGDDVAVIGHPRGFLWTLTTGIVSAVRDKYPMGSDRGTVVQTQAPVNPGNSGGPLLTLEGRLIGVITWVVSGAEGLNAAVGVNEVQTFVFRQATRFRQR